MTDRAGGWAPANGFQPRSEPGVHLAARKIHASRRSGKRCRKHPSRPARRAAASDCITIGLRRSAGAGTRRPVGRHVAPGAMLSTRRPVGFRPRRGGRERRWSPSLHCAHFPGSAEGCPSRRLRQVSPLRGRSDCITVRLGRSGGRRHCRRSGIHGSARRFSTSARRSDRRWPFTARIFQALPRVAHRGGMASGRPAITGSPVGSPVLKLWNESRTNRARIADSLHVRFRSRPHIVADQSPTTKSCNRPDTIAAARASTR